MQSLWNDATANSWRARGKGNAAAEALALRVYTSQLLGREMDLVLHGGGNTSVKVEEERRRIIHVKGSGWDLATIEAPGLPSIVHEPLLATRKGPRLSDPEMVALLRKNMIDLSGPNPSVETLLHAFLPAAFVDHTHSAAALVIADQPNAAELAKEIFGKKLAIVPYVMPGFDLAIEAANCFDKVPDCEGLFLVNHGLFSFHDDARTSYEAILAFTTACEDFIARHGAALRAPEANGPLDGAAKTDVLGKLAQALQAYPAFMKGVTFDVRSNASISEFLAIPDLEEVSGRGTITPDHVIRLKQKPVLGDVKFSAENWKRAVVRYVDDYTAYFSRHAPQAAEPKAMLDPLPRVALVRGLGVVGIGRNDKEARICADLAEQAARVIVAAEKLGRFTPIKENEFFDMEYWSLEQAKLKSA
ncbi:class II aldolase/adducin family protein [Mesorhizobium sp. VK9D]|uniref:class II aldolase/adducin family protein n=1 Tax=Mesorhizobium australafricanum TaxID=3072311 RepID=UPI002A24B5C6|nr:class II aldolase/adducin family protein [Mesorhizobium sp. VK9D]MDX8454264.1 class II aldolase/adducin family protein [Mesorhizobium sp. VK9D]